MHGALPPKPLSGKVLGRHWESFQVGRNLALQFKYPNMNDMASETYELIVMQLGDHLCLKFPLIYVDVLLGCDAVWNRR
jgi:hypothetical protein